MASTVECSHGQVDFTAASATEFLCETAQQVMLLKPGFSEVVNNTLQFIF